MASIPSESKLKVEFGDPEHGWIDLTIRSGAEAVTFAVSYVLYDTLDEMVWALQGLVIGYTSGSARIFEEPEISELRFKCENGSVRFQVCVGLSFGGRRGVGGRTVLEANGSLLEMCLPFWRALRNLQARFSEKEFERRWRRSFPTWGMDRLAADLKRLRDQ